MKGTLSLEEARKTSPRLGVPVTSGNYLFSEWQRNYPDLSSGDYMLPCSNAELIYVCAADTKDRSRKTADDCIDFAENEISKVISEIVRSEILGVRRIDNPKYLDALFQLLREASFAKSRYGGSCRVRCTEKYRKEIHNRGNNYWQDNTKKGKF